MGFSYPPLPPGDGLRILSLSPGQFWDPLEGALLSTPFSKKPKYIALSYTWGDPDSRHGEIPAMPPPPSGTAPVKGTAGPAAPAPIPAPYITLDGQELALYHNVTLALRFLRSPTHPLPLWLDAACIDQSNIPERNAQVALMAFIFTRATAVIAWLGVPELGHSEPIVEALAAAWRDGMGKEIAARIAKPSTGGGGEASGSSLVSDIFNFEHPLVASNSKRAYPFWHRIAGGEMIPRVLASRYWTRLWVVQEVCLPRSITFVFGGEVWSEGAVRQMLAQAERTLGRVVGQKLGIDRLLLARHDRFTDKMRFEALVERFMGQGCAEVRDRVFGLVGLANDVDTTALGGPDPRKVIGDRSQQKLRGGEGSPQLGPAREKRGRALMKIDYKRPFHDIWMDVVLYMYFSAKPLLDFGKDAEEMKDERRVRLVRFAGVVQKAFEGKVEQELQTRSILDSGEPARTILVAKGYVAGTVVHLGPAYSDFLGSYREQQLWLGSWDEHYPDQDTSNLEKLREMEESYSAKIIEYTEADISRICNLSGTDTVAWSVLKEPPPASSASVNTSVALDDPVRFLGTDCCLGLAPREVRRGDLIIRFWNCDAAIAVRAKTHSPGDYELVARVDIAEPYMRRGDGTDHQAKDLMRVMGGVWPPRNSADRKPGATPAGLRTKAMYVRMDFETLQKISAAIVV